jgi:hypothetical protein
VESFVKKNLFGLSARTASIVAVLLCAVLTSCFFESDDNGLEKWLSDQGMPSSYKVQTLNVTNLTPLSVEAHLSAFPKSADVYATLGRASNLTHDLVLDVGILPDSDFMKSLNKSDTSGAYLAMFWQRPYYKAKQFPKDSVPKGEKLDINVSWKLELGKDEDFLDSIADIEDSVWYESLLDWEADGSEDMKVKMRVPKGDTALSLELPSALMESLKKVKGAAHLQLRLSAPKSNRIYRFFGEQTNYPPVFTLYADSVNGISSKPARMANVISSEEDCTECPVLHGGVFDSLVVELPPEPILEALSEFYGDEFPYTDGDKIDVRQTVIHAELTMSRDDSKGQNELGLPIQVVVGSYVDSADLVIRRMESYRVNNDVVLDEGHQNLVFHDGDSLTVQLTNGVRDFVNKASDGRSLKFMMRIGYPFLQEKDTTYSDYRTAEGDTVRLYFPYFDYARYDFSTSMDNPMSLKIWLASKRGDEE